MSAQDRSIFNSSPISNESHTPMFDNQKNNQNDDQKNNQNDQPQSHTQYQTENHIPMHTKTGYTSSFPRQLLTLLFKNIILAWRRKFQTICQCCLTPFIVILVLIALAGSASLGAIKPYQYTSPFFSTSTSTAQWTSHSKTQKEVYDFVWSLPSNPIRPNSHSNIKYAESNPTQQIEHVTSNPIQRYIASNMIQNTKSVDPIQNAKKVDPIQNIQHVGSIDTKYYIPPLPPSDFYTNVIERVKWKEARTKMFTTQFEMEDWLEENQNSTEIAVAFWDRIPETSWTPDLNTTKQVIGYSLLYNSSLPIRLPNMQLLLDRAILQEQLKRQGVPEQELEHLSLKINLRGTPRVAPPRNNMGQVFTESGPLYISIGVLMLLIFSSYAIVQEKEQKIRLSLTLVGMKYSAYVCSWFLTFTVTCFIFTMVLLLSGLAFQIFVFLETNFFALFITFFSFALSLAFCAFAMATIINTTRATLILSFVFIAAAYIINSTLANGMTIFVLYLVDIWWIKVIRILLQFYTPYNFAYVFAAIVQLTAPVLDPETQKYKKNVGFGFVDLFKPVDVSIQGFGSVSTAPAPVFNILFMWLNSVLLLLIGLYLDHVLPQESGVSESPIFFVLPSYWCPLWWGRRKKRVVRFPTEEFNFMPPDVQDECRLAHRYEEPSAVRIVNVHKTFSKKFLNCIPTGAAVRAIQGLNLSFPTGQITTILGENGAGKSTLFSAIIGLIAPSNGDIFVFNQSVRHALSRIRPMIGLCPQHDIVFKELTAFENALILGGIKGIPFKKLKAQIEERFKMVDIYNIRHQTCGSMSGGQVRRVSCCLATVGDPKLVIFDEPSSSTDAASRRLVWNLIRSMKKEDTCVLLTSHSMEECEKLADKVIIMGHGRCQCIGDVLNLKTRFGAGYNLKFTVSNSEQFREFMHKTFPEADCVSQDKNELLYNVKRTVSDSQLGVFFNTLESTFGIRGESKGKSILRHWTIQHTSLAKVFLEVSAIVKRQQDVARHQSMHTNTQPTSEHQVIVSNESTYGSGDATKF